MEPWCLLVALMSLDVGGAVTMKEPAEKKLHDHLLGERYSNLIRPTGNSSVKLTVKLGLRLSQLLEIDEKNQIMTTSVWLRQEWFDLRLRWDPRSYGGNPGHSHPVRESLETRYSTL